MVSYPSAPLPVLLSAMAAEVGHTQAQKLSELWEERAHRVSDQERLAMACLDVRLSPSPRNKMSYAPLKRSTAAYSCRHLSIHPRAAKRTPTTRVWRWWSLHALSPRRTLSVQQWVVSEPRTHCRWRHGTDAVGGRAGGAAAQELRAACKEMYKSIARHHLVASDDAVTCVQTAAKAASRAVRLANKAAVEEFPLDFLARFLAFQQALDEVHKVRRLVAPTHAYDCVHPRALVSGYSLAYCLLLNGADNLTPSTNNGS